MSKTLPVLDAAQSEIIAMVNRKTIFVASLGHNAGGEAALVLEELARPGGQHLLALKWLSPSSLRMNHLTTYPGLPRDLVCSGKIKPS